MFIFVGCAGGGTSSMFCQRMVHEINQHDQNLTAIFDDVTSVFKRQLAYGDQYDLIFAYGGIDAIRSYNAFDFGQLFDVVMVAPQVAYRIGDTEKLMAPYPTIVEKIPGKIFGTMNATVAYPGLLDELIVLDERRAYQSDIQTAEKARDKNIEIFVAGGSRDDDYFINLKQQLAQLNIRCLYEPFNLENLYDESKTDFEFRFIFGNASLLTVENFPQIARRINAFMIAGDPTKSPMKKESWLRDYQIDFHYFDKQTDFATVLDFLTLVEFKSESTSEISVDRFEKQELKPLNNFLGIIYWR